MRDSVYISLLALLMLISSPVVEACSCFTLEGRISTAEGALKSARYVVHVRVIAVTEDGRAQLQVLESFKGPPAGDQFEAIPGSSVCGSARFSIGEVALVTSFDGTVSTCDKYPAVDSLLKAFRKAALLDAPNKSLERGRDR